MVEEKLTGSWQTWWVALAQTSVSWPIREDCALGRGPFKRQGLKQSEDGNLKMSIFLF